VVQVSLVQPEEGESEAKKATGHLCTSQSPETSNSPNTVWEAWETYTSMCCDASPSTGELSTLVFSLQLVMVTLLQISASDTLDRWCSHSHSYQHPPYGGTTYTGSTVNHGLCREQNLVPHSVCGILQTSAVKIQKAHKGSTRNSAESALFQTRNTTTWATLATTRIQIHNCCL